MLWHVGDRVLQIELLKGKTEFLSRAVGKFLRHFSQLCGSGSRVAPTGSGQPVCISTEPACMHMYTDT